MFHLICNKMPRITEILVMEAAEKKKRPALIAGR
jgi:hypothetical protein